MIIDKFKTVSLAVALLAVLSGCGSSSSDDASTAVTLPALDVPAAAATADNTIEAVDSVFLSEAISDATTDTSLLLAAADTQDVGFDSVAFAMKTLDDARQITSNTYSLNQVISGTLLCDSGSGSYTLTATQTSADFTLSYNNCVQASITTNGTISLRITGTDLGGNSEAVNYMKVSFGSDFTLTSAYPMTIHGGSFIEISFSSPYDVLTGYAAGTLTSSIWFEALGQNLRFDNLTIDFTEDYVSDIFEECYRGGRIYINNLAGYMDIDPTYDPYCSDPFTTDLFTVVSGSTRLLGSNGSAVLFEVVANDTYRATDTDGNFLEVTY